MTAPRALACAVMALAFAASQAEEAKPGTAIVTRDQAPLRASPRDSGAALAVLWQGEALEVRGERLDYLQVWDYRRERGGFVHASLVRRTALNAAEAPELLAVVRFLRDSAGEEALGIGFAAAYIEAATPEALRGPEGIEALDAIGGFAERLARRSSFSKNKAAQAQLSAHLDVAARYGVNFAGYERDGRMHLCYDGDAFRRVLAMRSGPEQRARAALALTREDCIDPALGPQERRLVDEWRADTLDGVDATALPVYLKNRVRMRRAAVWSALAYQHARKGEPAEAATKRASSELAGVAPAELTDDDRRAYRDAAMRVNASRWAANTTRSENRGKRPHIVASAGRPGETCLSLIDEHDDARPLARRCTYGVVWTASATLNPEWTAFAIAVQQTASWRELWVFQLTSEGWAIRVLPPAATAPDVGCAEFAGWVPGGRKMLVAREAMREGKATRRFEVVTLGSLAVEHWASDASMLRAFRQWQDPSWKRETLALR